MLMRIEEINNQMRSLSFLEPNQNICGKYTHTSILWKLFFGVRMSWDSSALAVCKLNIHIIIHAKIL